MNTTNTNTNTNTNNNEYDFLPEDCIKIIKDTDFKTKVYLFEKWWTIKDCDENPSHLFVFGDNDIGKGLKGQAVNRYCKNAIGIPTKKIPSYNIAAYYTDSEYANNCNNILNAIINIIRKTVTYNKIALPKDG